MKISRKERKLIAINTTALPDIIFMLLFFFMVTTVVQTSDAFEMELPHLNNSRKKFKKELDVLHIFLDKVGQHHLVKINESSGTFEDLEALLSFEIGEIRKLQHLGDRAVLTIGNAVPMGMVNQLKAQLREEGVERVHYIHELENN